MNTYFVQVAIDIPIFKLFEYRWENPKSTTTLLAESENLQNLEQPMAPKIGQLVELEFGKLCTTGLILEVSQTSQLPESVSSLKIKKIIAIAPCPILAADILRLYQFAAKYYLRPIGEVIFSSIPRDWKKPDQWAKIIKNIEKREKKVSTQDSEEKKTINFNSEQAQCIEKLQQLSQLQSYQIALLQGITGSGKTAVYLEWVNHLTKDPNKQCLILVPEINLTPQLERTVKKYCDDKDVIVLHSHLTPTERNYAWWRIQQGQGQIILGTRLSILTPIKNLAAIIVDEEHDNSYKQQDGMRYSARDVAIWRAADLKIPILLCSATPSSETWLKVQEKKIHLLQLNQRAVAGSTLAQIVLIDLKKEKTLKRLNAEGISHDIYRQIETTAQRKKQSLIFINRRGFAPILTCEACAWKSECVKCSAWLVLHKKVGNHQKTMLQCHHCGISQWPPKACPDCGNQDLQTIGMGTQKIEEHLETVFPNLKILRIDTDATRKKGELETLFASIHDGEVDVIIGTQMLSKGHDFANIEAVIVLDIDKSLYSQDFRAIEKMFAQLVQVAGRSGRGQDLEESKILIQTAFPEHDIFKAIANERFNLFYENLLTERKIARLPPYSYQALIMVESKSMDKNMDVLNQVKQFIQTSKDSKECIVYDPVARSLQRVAGVERGQLLIESTNRAALQGLLENALDYCEAVKTKQRSIKIIIERDPTVF